MTSAEPPPQPAEPVPSAPPAGPSASSAPRRSVSRRRATRSGPPRPSAALGRYGEALAVRYLREQGMEVIDRNWRCEHGEVDVVALDGDCLVICEVKTRRSAGFGEPVEAVTFAKAMRLRRLAGAYLARAVGDAAGDGGARVAQVRVDVVGILCLPGRPAVLRHVVGVGS